MTATATTRAYALDMEHFDKWCRQRGLESAPATPERVSLYLRDLADGGYTYSTIARRRAGIAAYHKERGMPDPCRWPLVSDTLSDIKKRSQPPKRRKTLDLDGLQTMVASLSPSQTRDIRDKTILLVGFWGCYKRSDLSSLLVDDVGPQEVGSAAMIEGTDLCPVAAANRWVRHAGFRSGSLFRPIDRYGRICGDSISPQGINEIVSRVADSVGLDGVSSYSMRYGVIKAGLDANLSHRDLKEWLGVRSSRTLDKCSG